VLAEPWPFPGAENGRHKPVREAQRPLRDGCIRHIRIEQDVGDTKGARRQWEARVQSREPVDVRTVDVLDAVRAEREGELSRTGS
jgi:hypothetical protein